MKKREAIRTGIEQMDAEQRRLDEQRKKEAQDQKKDSARPSLIKRVFIGLIDFSFAAIMSFGFFVISYFFIFPSIGYQDSAEYIVETYKKSKLFVYGATGYETISSNYDENKSPEANYDVPITYYYTTDGRAVSEDQYNLYTTRKINSGLYELNGENECVRKSTISAAQAREYLAKEYSKAVDYFHENPKLKQAGYLVDTTMSVGLLIVATLGASIIYIIVPLFDKKNRTFAYMFFKVMPVDKDALKPIDKKKNLLRNVIFVIFCIISAFTMNIWFGTFSYSLIPFFINTIVLAFSKNNTGVNDLATNVVVINQSYSNPFETLKAINQQGGQY